VELSPTVQHLRSLPQNRHRRSQAQSSKQPKLTRALAERLCSLIAQTDQSLFTLIEQNPELPHHKTLFNWQQRVPWFAQMWKEARIKQTHFLIEKCLDLAKTAQPKTAHVVRVQFDIYRWFAAKFNPDTYGDKPPLNQQTTVNVGISIPAERLADLRSKLDQSRTAFLPAKSAAPIPKTAAPAQQKTESASPTC
jgi:hypothetical protein